MSDKNLKIIIDQVGRTIIGELADETDESFVLKNAATIYVQPNEAGQLQVQTIPLFFKEFLTLAGRESGALFTYPKNAVTDTDTGNLLDSKLVNQYEKIVDNLSAPEAETETPPEGDVVKLFDE